MAIWIAAVPLTAAPPVEQTLRKAAARAEDFFAGATQVSSVESVEQQKFNANGKLISRKRADYDYLVLMQLTGNELLTQETRELRGNAEKQPAHPLLLTKGFALLNLVLHPHFQSSYLFEDASSAEENQRGIRQLKFRFLAGSRSPSVLQLQGRNYPVPWQGRIWVEESTGAVVRVQAELGEGLADVGLESLTATVEYAPVEFTEPARVLWLPKTAVVELRTGHQHWRNAHSYAGYRHFQVSTSIEMGKPKEDDGNSRKP